MLQELNINFRNIILPEAVKTMQTQDPSVETSLGLLEQIVTEAGRPLDTILSQMEIQLRNAIMGMEVSTGNGDKGHLLFDQSASKI